MVVDAKSLDYFGKVGRGKSRHRPRNDPALYGGPYPFIQTADITNSDLYVTSYSQTYSEAGLSQSKLWEPGVLCIVNAGVNTGDSSILGIQACFPDSVISFSANPKRCDVRFIKYFLDSVKSGIRSITMGATQDNLSVSKLLTIKVPAYTLETQRKIAGILSAYDDLIENNRRRIAILERMAEELYREWFVRMRFPGYQNTKFVKGVPEGWEQRKLGEVITLNYGKALKAEYRVTGPYPVYGSSGIVGTHIKPLVDRPGLIVGRKGNVGSVYYSDLSFYPIDTAYYVESKLADSYLYHLLSSMNFINNDAAVPGLNRNQAYSNLLLLPQHNLIEAFEDLVGKLVTKTRKLRDSISLLTSVRENLLNRLVSGKLRVTALDIRIWDNDAAISAEMEQAHA